MKTPFKMLPSRQAVLRCDGKFVVAGRASFVWETLLLRRASGVPGEYEIKRGEHGAPWHRVELEIEEAEQLLGLGWLGSRRVARVRKLRVARASRGLSVS